MDKIEIVDSAKSFAVKNYKEYPDGSLLCWFRVARDGVYDYGSHKDYLSKDQLFDDNSLNSIVGTPITLNHPERHIKNLDERARLSVGTILQETVEDKDGETHFLTVPGLITNEQVKQHIIRGDIRQVSPGHLTTRIKVDDSSLGYQYEQRDRQYNHVALVGEGRAGNAQIILNDAQNSQNSQLGFNMGNIIKLLLEYNDSLKKAGITPNENWQEIDLKRAIVFALSGKKADTLTVEACDSLIDFLPKVETQETVPPHTDSAVAPTIVNDSTDPIGEAKKRFIKRLESTSLKG